MTYQTITTTIDDTSTDFRLGATYWHAFAGDSAARVVWAAVARTRCFVTLRNVADPQDCVRCRVRRIDGVEQCEPMGRYSMSPILRANRWAEIDDGSQDTAEENAVRFLIATLSANGIEVGAVERGAIWSTETTPQAIASVPNTTVRLRWRGHRQVTWARLVFGNDLDEIVADWGVPADPNFARLLERSFAIYENRVDAAVRSA